MIQLLVAKSKLRWSIYLLQQPNSQIQKEEDLLSRSSDRSAQPGPILAPDLALAAHY